MIVDDNIEITRMSQKFLETIDDQDNEVIKRAKEISNNDPFQKLKVDLLNFFRSRINEISSQEALREEIAETFREDIQGETLDFDQRMRLYKLISSQSGGAIESIMGLFKPTPGAPSILAENLSKKEDKEDIYRDIFDKMSSNDLQKLDKMMKFLEKMSDEEK
jgi:secreted Zn-dependent insulinase-like peptidase